MNTTIDAVFLWVDGSDPNHLRKRLARWQESNPAAEDDERNHPTRFADNGELWYSINFVRQYAPFIGRIYIVTDNQSPIWLTDAIADEFGIRIIDHTTIFRGYSEFLPTFNSVTIETMIHRIPDLSERFIYFNDDTFIINPTTLEDYFEGDLPVIRGRWVWVPKSLRRISNLVDRCRGIRHDGFINRISHAKADGDSRYFELAHAPRGLRKTWIDDLLTDPELLVDSIRHPFRKPMQPSLLHRFARRAIREEGSPIKQKDWVFIDIDHSLDETRNRLEQCLNTETKHLCIQSMDQFDDVKRTLCINHLRNRLALNHIISR